MKKGQAAMEFLMTYGWALLVVLAAVAALAYFGVLSPNKFLPEQCQFPASSGLTCLDKPVLSATNNDVRFAIKNNKGSRVNITGITDVTTDDCAAPTLQACAGVGCTPAAIPNGIVFENDQQGIMRVSCTAVPAGRFNLQAHINYYSFDTGLPISSTGNIKGESQ